MSIEHIYCSRREFLQSLIALGLLPFSEGLPNKEIVWLTKTYGLLLKDLPAYQLLTTGYKMPLEGVYFPQGCLLRFEEFIFEPDGIFGKCWFKIKQDSWLYNSAAVRTQENLLIPFNWFGSKRKEIDLLTAKDMQPISSLKDPLKYVGPEDKRIEIDLGAQTLYAFENDDLVLTSSVSTGLLETTPTGVFSISAKQISRYMQGADFDLPGVPFNCYFTSKGHAIHGTYWHGLFGTTPQSHGCVNAPNDIAFLLLRWTDPVMNFNEEKTYGPGTKVIIR